MDALLWGLICFAFLLYFLVINPIKEHRERKVREFEKQKEEMARVVSRLQSCYWRGYHYYKEKHPEWGVEEFYHRSDEIRAAHYILESDSEREEIERKVKIEQRSKEWAEKIAKAAVEKARKEGEIRKKQQEKLVKKYQGSTLFFDTETTGTPRNYKAPVTDSYNWPRLVQLAWLMVDKDGNILKQKSVIIKPDGFSIPSDASAMHGITTERAQREGRPLNEILNEFMLDLSLAIQVVGHNIDFDMHIVSAELYRMNLDYNLLMDKPSTCTMKSSTDYCAIPQQNNYYGGYKWPSLQELYRKLFNREFVDAHDALADITATKECFFELRKRGII